MTCEVGDTMELDRDHVGLVVAVRRTMMGFEIDHQQRRKEVGDTFKFWGGDGSGPDDINSTATRIK